MAKSLDERIVAAMSGGARIATVQGLIGEVEEALAVTQSEHDAAHALSISASATEAEADEAADAASRLSRKMQRLTAKRQQIEARVAELQASERQQRLAKFDQGVIDRRDQLAADLRDRWPGMAAEMASLIERIYRSDAECATVGHHVESAECIARGVPQNFYMANHGPVTRLIDMRVVNLTGLGWDEMAWPPREQPMYEAEASQARQAAALGTER